MGCLVKGMGCLIIGTLNIVDWVLRAQAKSRHFPPPPQQDRGGSSMAYLKGTEARKCYCYCCCCPDVYGVV